jgi:hypothetical protein
VKHPTRTILIALTGSLFAIVIGGWLTAAIVLTPEWFARSFAVDYGIYMEAVDRFLRDGSWYVDRQLHGPYPIELGDVLYPPVLLYLLVPFRLLGPYLWSLIPAIVVAAVTIRHRPALWGWLLIALCLAWPVTVAKFIFGNPVIWGAAAVALGTVFRWPSALVVIKPTVIPFALIGIRDRRWWLAIVGLAVLSLPFLGLTLLYPQVLLDAQTNPVDGRGGPLYSLQEYPLLLIPILAWWARGGRNFRDALADLRVRPATGLATTRPPEAAPPEASADRARPGSG